nr:MAG TPA: hypothetical protein [Caudoviricetes sp.]DAX05456.1 MAG TPA: hypothetical protein [Bacteriophage sp.]
MRTIWQSMHLKKYSSTEQSAQLRNAGRLWNVRIRELLLLKKKIMGLKNIHVMHAVGTWVGQLEHFLLVIAGNVVRNWIGVMKNELKT